MKSKSKTKASSPITAAKKPGLKEIIEEYRKKFAKSLIKISENEIIELKNEGRR
jgi:hypothetical protein